MKTKLLTICLFLFASQVFAEDIIMKCHQGENKPSLTYKYSESLVGTHEIQLWRNGKWKNLCSEGSTTYEGCRMEISCVKSKMYAEKILTNTNIISGACFGAIENKIVVDFLNKEVTYIGKYDYGDGETPAAKKFNNPRITNSCSRIYD